MWYGNGTDLGMDVFQTLHYLSEQSPDTLWTEAQLPGVNQLTQSLVLTILHLHTIMTGVDQYMKNDTVYLKAGIIRATLI